MVVSGLPDRTENEWVSGSWGISQTMSPDIKEELLKLKSMTRLPGRIVVHYLQAPFLYSFILALQFTITEFVCSKPLGKLSLAFMLLIFSGRVNDCHCSSKSTPGIHITEGH